MNGIARVVAAGMSAGAFVLLHAAVPMAAGSAGAVEVREYRGVKLDPYDREYDNSIRGPQKVPPASYRLTIDGLVDTPRSMTYDQVLALPRVTRQLTLHCVEGWSEALLFEGVRIADLLALAAPKEGARTVIFHAADGYTSSLRYDLVRERDLMIAARINGLVLDETRGFPFQVVAEDRYGYKWVKWLTRIELSDKEYRGYWERGGYDNEAEVKMKR
jgi:DMSO/TMAO reductase YedYZ molybdopterin-dependent catalytic subunit